MHHRIVLATLAALHAAAPLAADLPADAPAAPLDAAAPGRFVKGGVVVEFSLDRPGAPVTPGSPLLEGDHAEVRFRLQDAATDAPLRGLKPAAWLDVGGGAQGD